ncbi:MAG: hypothetical protein N0C90_19060 [Candidatus Thiodiazotropha endolucinida]|nr:hypothetical protein [Candidatus Thiodiazotropha taylori]MCW4263456.1 hypothetical protein [Candidatus Thiodiazotropha endolucinida]
MVFGNAKPLYRRLLQKDGISQNSFSFVFVVWQGGIPGNYVQEAANAAKMDAESFTIGCCTNRVIALKLN